MYIFKDFSKGAGHKKTHLDCYYCGLHDDKVEAGGMWYCPNPICTGPGGAWFRAKLDSYTPDGSGHTIDAAELLAKGSEYLDQHPELLAKVRALYDYPIEKECCTYSGHPVYCCKERSSAS